LQRATWRKAWKGEKDSRGSSRNAAQTRSTSLRKVSPRRKRRELFRGHWAWTILVLGASWGGQGPEKIKSHL